jgi:hypothetical protein
VLFFVDVVEVDGLLVEVVVGVVVLVVVVVDEVVASVAWATCAS